MVVTGFDGLDAVFECLFQDALADGPEHQAEETTLEVLPVAYHNHINIGLAVWLSRESVCVTGRASPEVRVRRLEDDVVGIGPIVVQPLPNAARALRDVGLRTA